MTQTPTDRNQALRDAQKVLDRAVQYTHEEATRQFIAEAARLLRVALAMQEPASEPAPASAPSEAQKAASFLLWALDCGQPVADCKEAWDVLRKFTASETAPASAPSCCGADALIEKAKRQIAYWQAKVDAGKTFDDCSDENGEVWTPLGDDDAYAFGLNSGHRDEARWWEGQIEAARAQPCRCGELDSRKIARDAVRAARQQVQFAYRPGQHVMTPDWYVEGCIADAIDTASPPRTLEGK